MAIGDEDQDLTAAEIDEYARALAEENSLSNAFNIGAVVTACVLGGSLDPSLVR